jgi:NADH-quinone oxidoreductase subunit M
MPAYAVFFLILTLASIGLPTTSGFTGEFLALLGAFNAGWLKVQQGVPGGAAALAAAVVAVTGVVLGALYMLRLAQQFLFGAERAPHQPLAALDLRETGVLVVLVAAVFALGLAPQAALRTTETAARHYQMQVGGAAVLTRPETPR